uniref:E3 ubiquitin-protein ligase Mdm2 n=1 Tax=Phallusia mammillata TaxID=59560 RepID=A0A6F9DL71_9ASCI|nr:E3 ubiquitin-protein ligase Mdm2 [Phallusia mammillata]
MTSQQYFLTRPKLLAILQMGGAQGQLFTAEQVVYFLGKYIEQKELYDPSNKRIIRCENDLLGEVLQVPQFFVTDFKNLWKLVFPCLIPATKRELSSTDLVEDQGESSTDLPWWYFVSRSRRQTEGDEATEVGSYAGKETVGIQDSVYDSDEEPIEFEPIDSESDDSDATEPVSSDDEIPNLETLKKFQTDSDEETTTTDFSMDSDILLEPVLKLGCGFRNEKEHWSCVECGTKNTPTVGFCQRCWKLRKGWVSDGKIQQQLERSMTDPTQSQEKHSLPRTTSLDVPDCSQKSSSSGFFDMQRTSSQQSDIKPVLPNFESSKHKLTDQTQDPCIKKPHLDDSVSDSDASKQGSCSSVSTNSSGDSPHFPGLCNICRNNPNDATIVHGNNGHQFCCFRCAKRLKNRGKNCPVCRQPIMLVIKNFIVQF